MSFSAKLFSIKGNLVFMNNFYHKIATASVCTALSFTLGANQEVKAATFTLTASRFTVFGHLEEGGQEAIDYNYLGPSIDNRSDSGYETRAFYEFNIGNLFLASDTVISRASFFVGVSDIVATKFFLIEIMGYVGNGGADLSDFEAGERVAVLDIYGLAYGISLDVTQFVNQRVNNGDAFAGLGLRGLVPIPPLSGSANLAYIAELNIETKPVPEPTTIFGSALALGVGGWLKRKKSGQENKTTSH
jgi:hypothetical protein